MNRVCFKYLAIAAMLADHIGALLLPPGSAVWLVCRMIGRLSCPILCFFLAEGYRYTASKSRYALRLGLFACLTQPIYSYAFFGTFWGMELNILFSFLISFLMLWSLDTGKSGWYRGMTLFCGLLLSCFCDWGAFAPLLVLAAFWYRENRRAQCCAYVCILAAFVVLAVIGDVNANEPWYASLWQLGTLLSVPLLLLYNGKPGPRSLFHKWFFYVFYPLHLLSLALVQVGCGI